MPSPEEDEPPGMGGWPRYGGMSVKGVDKMPVADPIGRLQCARLSLEQPPSFKAMELQVDDDFDLRAGSDTLITISPPGGERGHHDEATALVNVEPPRNEAVGEKAFKPLPVCRVVSQLRNEVEVTVDVAIRTRECTC